MMRITPLFCFALVASASATASTNGVDPPLHFKGDKITLVVHKGQGGTPLGLGYNPVDDTRGVRCHSERGCIITIQAMVSADDTFSICTRIDGSCAHPPSPPNVNDDYLVTLQSKHVEQGNHKIQTFIDVLDGGNPLGSWEVNYTIYEL